MDKIINKILFGAKIIILLVAFTITLYISFMKMDAYELSFFSFIPMFIPLFLVLIAFVFSFFLGIGNNNTFFNIVCILVLLAVIIIDYRTIFDSNIISKTKLHFQFFDTIACKMKVMLYLTFISNILLMIYEKKEKIHS